MRQCRTLWAMLPLKLPLSLGWMQLKLSLISSFTQTRKISAPEPTPVTRVRVAQWNSSFLVQQLAPKTLTKLFPKWVDTHQFLFSHTWVSTTASGSTTRRRCWSKGTVTSPSLDSPSTCYGVILNTLRTNNTLFLTRLCGHNRQSIFLIKKLSSKAAEWSLLRTATFRTIQATQSTRMVWPKMKILRLLQTWPIFLFASQMDKMTSLEIAGQVHPSGSIT